MALIPRATLGPAALQQGKHDPFVCVGGGGAEWGRELFVYYDYYNDCCFKNVVGGFGGGVGYEVRDDGNLF